MNSGNMPHYKCYDTLTEFKNIISVFSKLWLEYICKEFQNVVAKFHMLLCHNMIDMIYILTCKPRQLEGDFCNVMGEYEIILLGKDIAGEELIGFMTGGYRLRV